MRLFRSALRDLRFFRWIEVTRSRFLWNEIEIPRDFSCDYQDHLFGHDLWAVDLIDSFKELGSWPNWFLCPFCRVSTKQTTATNRIILYKMKPPRKALFRQKRYRMPNLFRDWIFANTTTQLLIIFENLRWHVTNKKHGVVETMGGSWTRTRMIEETQYGVCKKRLAGHSEGVHHNVLRVLARLMRFIQQLHEVHTTITTNTTNTLASTDSNKQP